MIASTKKKQEEEEEKRPESKTHLHTHTEKVEAGALLGGRGSMGGGQEREQFRISKYIMYMTENGITNPIIMYN